MKLEVYIDYGELVSEISREVVKAIKPMLEKEKKEDTIYTVKSLARHLQVSDKWVYERVHLKTIPHIKIGKFPRFKKSVIDRWLESHQVISTR